MRENAFCRIGLFYDGSFFSCAQRHFYYSRKLGWLDVRKFQSLLEAVVRKQQPGFGTYKVAYGAWFQGLHSSAQGDDEQRRRDRNQHHDLANAGVVPKFVPMSSAQREKGVDVALAVDALQAAHDRKMEVAVLVTGDGNLVPLVRALQEKGVRVLIAYFKYEDEKGNKGFCSPRLLGAANDDVNINALEDDEELRADFRALFRSADEARD